MKLLGFVLAGVVLGLLIGSFLGEFFAKRDAGGLSFLIVDNYKKDFAGRGALVGAIVGAIACVFTKEG